MILAPRAEEWTARWPRRTDWIENLVAVYVPLIGHDLKIAVPFALIFVILILRPQGLFGRLVVVRV